MLVLGTFNNLFVKSKFCELCALILFIYIFDVSGGHLVLSLFFFLGNEYSLEILQLGLEDS